MVLPRHSAAPPLDLPKIYRKKSALPSLCCLSHFQVPLCQETLEAPPPPSSQKPPAPSEDTVGFPVQSSRPTLPGCSNQAILISCLLLPARASDSLPTSPGAFSSNTQVFGEHLPCARHCGANTVGGAGRMIITRPDPCPYTRTQRIDVYIRCVVQGCC